MSFPEQFCGQPLRPGISRTTARRSGIYKKGIRARWRSSSSIMMVPSGSSSTATARRRPSCSASGRPAWTPTAPFTGSRPTAARATTTRTICPESWTAWTRGNLYFDGSNFPWKLADDFEEDKRWGYPAGRLLGRLTGKTKDECKNCKKIHIDMRGMI